MESSLSGFQCQSVTRSSHGTKAETGTTILSSLSWYPYSQSPFRDDSETGIVYELRLHGKMAATMPFGYFNINEKPYKVARLKVRKTECLLITSCQFITIFSVI